LTTHYLRDLVINREDKWQTSGLFEQWVMP
jgi:hypothetical protein